MPRASNRYDPDRHEEYLACPRSRCTARNAPPDSDDFEPHCWKCGVELPRKQPVSVGDEVVVEITDIHQSGEGLGRTDDGFIILVDGVVPGVKVRARVSEVKSSYARSKLIERLPDDADEKIVESDDEDASETESEKDDPALGSRDNFWG